MHVVQRLDEDVWKEFVDQHPHGNIFHTPEMFQVFARAKGCQPTVWAVMGQGEQILALFSPVQITVRGGLFRYLTTRAVGYGSVLCAPGPEGREALTLLLRTYNQETKGSLLFTELRNLSDLSDLQPALQESGFAYEAHLNFLLDLARPQAEIWKGIRSNAQRNVRKALKSGVVIEEVNDPARVPAAYALLKQVYKRIQVPLPDQSLFQAAFDILYPRGMLRILTAKVEGVDIGVLTLLMYKGVIYYWYTGPLKEYAAYRAGDLLVWHTLEMGSQNGFHTFDFGGGGKPDEEYGVRDFKAKFGGALVNYGRNVCIHAPLRLRLSQFGYRLVRKYL